MYKILLLLSLVFSSVFAQVDANLEVVKKTNALPKILVSVATDTAEIETLNKIKKSLADDLSVSGHFEVVSVNSVTSYENMPDIIGLSNQGVNLYLNLSAKKEADSYTLMTKLYDINSRTLLLEKNFATTQEDRYVFLAHKAAISTNSFFKAPSIDWMEKFVVFSTYTSSGAADIMIGDYTLTYKKTVVTGGLNIFPKISIALSPEILTIPIPPSPLGVEIAAIVSNIIIYPTFFFLITIYLFGSFPSEYVSNSSYLFIIS